jgi:hypothetical protein
MRAVSGTGACGKSRPVGDTAGRGAQNAPEAQRRGALEALRCLRINSMMVTA